MKVTMRGHDCDFTMNSEVQIGRNWSAYHEVTNTEGMRDMAEWLKNN
jgi:hypothetical protein